MSHASQNRIGISKEPSENEYAQRVTTIVNRERNGVGYKMATGSSRAGKWDTLITVKTHGSF
jgi:hypothetical protein